MFSYYGSKSKIVSLYPKPRYNLVIEPFAGCAWYSLLYSNFRLTKIAESLNKIKHFQVKFGSYQDLDNVEATWFIDPPYQVGGEHYIENKIDYQELSDWCLSRKGQIIVCENSEAKWLPFQPLVKINGQRKKTIEVIYTN